VDLEALRSNLRKWNKTGIVGYVVLGSTGEKVNLNEPEYLQVIEAARAEVPDGPDGLAFIVGAGQQSSENTIREVRRAAGAGADAALVITPYFYRPSITQEALIRHYLAVADASPVPIILYSMPALTGIKIDPATAAQLSGHPNIIGIKDSSADLAEFRETLRLAGESGPDDRGNFAVLTGNGTVLYEALRAGAHGAILAVGCVVPEVCLEIFRAFERGDAERAAALQEKLTPLARAVTTTFGIGGLKAALDMIGYAGDKPRAPLQSPDNGGCEEISHLLMEAQAAISGLPSHQLVGD
jgi:4-hydroxy-2-oxoglutarate aldolase